jgi:hypothetical protein
MKFKTGDIVRFLNETGGGKVTRLDDRGYIYIMTEDGFEIPVLANELILQSPASEIPEGKIFADTGIAVADKTKYQPPVSVAMTEIPVSKMPENLPSDTPLKILLGLVPENSDAVFKTTINSFLINDSEYYVYYRVGYQQQGRFLYLRSGEIEPNTKSFLADFNQNRLSKISFFHIQALAVCAGQYYKKPPLDEEIDITRYDFMKYHTYKANEYFDENALILGNSGDFNPQQVKAVDFPADTPADDLTGTLQGKKAGAQISDTMEVDLHIEALREDHSQLSNTEILRIQMNRFRSALEDAISNKTRRIVFIHGVGNGTLKLELRNELKRSYPEYTYQDASFKEYGFGATLIHLR